MSQENVELAREAIDRFNRGDDDATLDALYDPNAVWHSRTDEPDTGIYQGRESIRELWRMWRGMFEDFRAEVEEYIDAGDHVISPGWLCGRGRDSGVEVREPYTWVGRWRDGKLVEIREYRTKAEALEAVGLWE
jgi:ketosteroid isomerase-like protein